MKIPDWLYDHSGKAVPRTVEIQLAEASGNSVAVVSACAPNERNDLTDPKTLHLQLKENLH